MVARHGGYLEQLEKEERKEKILQAQRLLDWIFRFWHSDVSCRVDFLELLQRALSRTRHDL